MSKSGYPAGALSNFAPHPFEIDGVKCNSMEGFLQSLKFHSVDMQRHVCSLVGFAAKKKGGSKDWRQKQELYWLGKTYKRDSPEYQDLLNRAYNELYKNSGFRKALEATRGATLTHSIGKTRKNETILTASEFCSRLTYLRDRGPLPVVDRKAESVRQAGTQEGYALKSELKDGSFSNGMWIVEREGKQAYADVNLKIVSGFHHVLYPFGKRFGCARNEEGKFNYIRPDGTEFLPVWVDAVSKASEGFSVIQRDGLYNHVDGNGRIVSEDWCGVCRDFHDGWAVIQASADDAPGIRGMFNYVNGNGNVMFDIAHWLDAAGDFKDGRAMVKRGGRQFQIDTEGRALGVRPPSGGAGGGGTKRGV